MKGSVYCSDAFKSDRDLKRFGKHLPVNHRKVFSNGHSHINGIEGFWSFAKRLHAKTEGSKSPIFPTTLPSTNSATTTAMTTESPYAMSG